MPPKKQACIGHPSEEFNPNSDKFLDNLVLTCPGSDKDKNKTNYTGMTHSLTCREGSKKDLLKCVFPLFPHGNEAPDLFVDLFMGSGVVSLNYVKGMDVPKDGKAWTGEGKHNVEIKAKDGCEVWTNDLASIIPLTHKALQDIGKKGDKAMNDFIAEAVRLGSKVDYASGPKTRNNKKTFDLSHPKSKAYQDLDADELINKRATYLLHKADFGATPKAEDGGLMAMLGSHHNKTSMNMDDLAEAFENLGIADQEEEEDVGGGGRGGGPKKKEKEDGPSKASQVPPEQKLGPHIDYLKDGDYNHLFKWYTDSWKEFKEEYKGLSSNQKKAKRDKLTSEEKKEPPHCDLDCLNKNVDVFVHPALKKIGWLVPKQEANFKKYLSWKGTPLEGAVDGKIRLRGEKGAKIKDNGIIEKSIITPEGLVNVNAVTCGSMSSMGFGAVYKYSPLNKKNIEENIKYGKNIVFSTGDYIKVLERVKDYHQKNRNKKIFIFADPPYPEGQDYEMKGKFTYGKAFDQVKFENACYELVRDTGGMVKILVTNGYKEWLNQYLRWRMDTNGKNFWNIWRIIVRPRGGMRTKPREELIYSTYTPVLPGEAKREVTAKDERKRDTSDNPDNKDKPEGKLKCMPKDEWKTLTDTVWKNMTKSLKLEE